MVKSTALHNSYLLIWYYFMSYLYLIKVKSSNNINKVKFLRQVSEQKPNRFFSSKAREWDYFVNFSLLILSDNWDLTVVFTFILFKSNYLFISLPDPYATLSKCPCLFFFLLTWNWRNGKISCFISIFHIFVMCFNIKSKINTKGIQYGTAP